jgi:acetoacetyl-CoA synthetase
MSHKLWSPPSGIRTNIDDFKDIIRNKYQLQLGIKALFRTLRYRYLINLESYWDLYEWSIKNISKFWEEFWLYSDIKYSVPFEQVCQCHLSFLFRNKFNYKNNLGIRRKKENE